MEVLRIEILNQKAMKLIQAGHAGIELIRVSEEPISKVKAYLKKMRENAASAPSLDEITKIVEKARTERYTGK